LKYAGSIPGHFLIAIIHVLFKISSIFVNKWESGRWGDCKGKN